MITRFVLVLCLISLVGMFAKEARRANVPQDDSAPIENKEEHLIHAAAQGNLQELKRAIKAGAVVNTKDGLDGNSALIWAAIGGYVDCLHALVNAGADIEIRSSDGHKTALMMAVYKQQADAVKYLLSKSANVDTKNERGDTALGVAAYIGNAVIARMLIERGATIDSQTNKDGYTPLHLAAFKGNAEVAKLLVDSNANIDVTDRTGKSPLLLAAMEGHADTVRVLLDNDANIDVQDKNDNTALILAITGGKLKEQSKVSKPDMIDCVETLINAGSLLNIQNYAGFTALIYAAAYSYTDIVSLLLRHRADCSVRTKSGSTALDVAVKQKHDIVVTILESNCDSDSTVSHNIEL